eukprot:NODE_15664_length_1037_cov_6.672527.p6 GENE.NODE_15664_length_1037_cov_6.672527~~NODE_15664_length_1037_cov_6.672527.p6  ORF type:complete len:58 (+),score=32.82 NODE_15664_length_1037_cov_6.672527:784-957(+)
MPLQSSRRRGFARVRRRELSPNYTEYTLNHSHQKKKKKKKKKKKNLSLKKKKNSNYT